MRKPNIKKLKYPIWFNITFAILTLVVPLGLFMAECLGAAQTQSGTVFKITFVAVVILIIAWLFLNHFVLSKIKTKLVSEQSMLEHDYTAEVGNTEKIKLVWYANSRWLTLFEFVSVLLYGGLGYILLTAVQTGLIKIRAILIIIAICYVLAYTIRFILLMTIKEPKHETEETSRGNSKESGPKDNS